MTDKQPITEDKSKLIEMLNSFPYIKIELKDEIVRILIDGQKTLEELPKYVKALAETNALYENRKLEVSYLTEENQKLKANLEYWNNMHNESLQREDILGNEIEELEQENQKLKERLKEKEELLDWTINYGEYVIYGLRTEIEELKRKYNIEHSNFTITKLHNDDYIERLQKENRELKKQNQVLFDTADTRFKVITQLQQESKQAIDRIKLTERFLSKVKFTNTCWNWADSLATDGYGQFWDGEKTHTAHRFAYMIFIGDIPNDKHIDHLCRNHSCVNPAHLEAVTNKENILRGIGVTANNARKTHCKRGHLLEGDNLFIDTKTNQRMCKTCKSLRNRKII